MASSGCAMTERPNRTVPSAWKRWSAIMVAIAARMKKVRRARGDGPRWKKDGDSRIIIDLRLGPYPSVVREYRPQLVHLFQRAPGAAHYARERIVRHDDR